MSFMLEAVELAKRGYPAPNPRVGCVIVRQGKIVGRGYHDHAGGPHAEAMALRDAGELARGAEAYVTLEPCNHHGRTPPCSHALIQAGIKKVTYAVSDPNPRAQGGGEALRAAGVETVEGVMKAEAAEVNRLFLGAHRLGRPVVVAKAAMSLDGRIALPSGESKWITDEAARTEGHRLRAELGAVLVGPGTVRADNPQLTARLPEVVNQPLRIALDPRVELSGKERMFQGPPEQSVHIVPVGSEAATRQLILPLEGGRFSPKAILSELWRMGQIGLLIEGGGRTIASFLEAGVLDRVELFIAPKLFGSGPAWLEGMNPGLLSAVPHGAIKATRMIGPDCWLSIDLQPSLTASH
jgi:diaminohydroxyphosphoribosylaminopyrimidine deaminase / 5-amino-6-(5-phosphoribosylamino)uracil reductase